MHMAAARLGCKKTVVSTRYANSCPGCMSRLRKRYSHLLGGSFLAGKASRALSGCVPTESANYCMLVNEWAWLTLSGPMTLYGVMATQGPFSVFLFTLAV